MTAEKIANFIWARMVNRLHHVRVSPDQDGHQFVCVLHFPNGTSLNIYVAADADEAELEELIRAARQVAG